MYTGPFDIPALAPAALAARVHKTQPLVRRGKKLWMIHLPDLYNVSFIWDPKTIEAVVGLKEVGRVTTLHTFGHPVYFKPSIAEVLCWMPADLDADFFEVTGPEMADDLNRESIALNEGYHVGEAIFYKRK